MIPKRILNFLQILVIFQWNVSLKKKKKNGLLLFIRGIYKKVKFDPFFPRLYPVTIHNGKTVWPAF